MRRLKKISSKDKRIYQITIALFIAICLLIGLSCLKYYEQLQYTVKTESSGYMQEISKQMGTNISKSINDNFSVLGTIATSVKNSDISTYDQFKQSVTEQQVLWDYKKIMLIDVNGIAHDYNGNSVALNSDEYLQDAIVGRKPAFSSSQVIDGEECVVFAVPIQNVSIEGTQMLCLAASYDLSTFDRILSMTAFEGKGYAHIIRRDGSSVIRSSSINAMQTGYNVLTSLATAQIHDRVSFDEVRADIANGISGQVEFSMGDRREYMTYTPLNTQEWCLLTFVPVSVVNAKSSLLLNLTLLISAFITVAFSLLFAGLMYTTYRNRRKLERIAYVDMVTGGNTIQCFNELAQESLDDAGKTQFAIVYTNIEKFKVLNEQFGKNACDSILKSIQSGVDCDLGPKESIGRLTADNFCILVEYTNEADLVSRFEKWNKNSLEYVESIGGMWLPLIIEFGVYVIVNDTMPLAHMVDRAKLSLTEAASEMRGKIKYAIYDEKVRSALFREKHLEDMMEDALNNGHFQVYLQPKYNTHSESIGGAEALVRWVSPTEGMIYPDEFISLFEKNGFVIQLDLYVFEQVCKTLERWIEEGKDPVKVSVNCSRVHLKNPHFLDKFVNIANKYKVPRDLLEMELTENTVFGDVGHLSKIIMHIHDAGFGCSMDDFGSGYSSLNLIQDIPVDTLKLDKVFFKSGSKDLSRTESVVGSIISMSKALSMKTVAEGVEERPQVEMLKRLNCDYIQGYYFAKPMPIDKFEQLAFGKKDD